MVNLLLSGDKEVIEVPPEAIDDNVPQFFKACGNVYYFKTKLVT
jgi:hypothetical protein